ncbi:MAG: hypothetical protein HDT43_13470 [Ruminococcaceae bacterium]|nr:hypothetical protein [Oscillospiraceae bacterium]
MTKQEQLFEAIGGIDDDIAANALRTTERCGRKIPFKLVLIAAALAAVSLLVGFTVIFKNTVEQNGKKLIEFNIKIYDDLVHPSFEELTEMGAYDLYDGTPGVQTIYRGYWNYGFYIKADPRTVIEKYGLDLTVNNNDNFTTANSEEYSEDQGFNWFYQMHVGFGVNEYIENMGQNEAVLSFMFGLVDKRLDLPVSFITWCYTEELNVPVSYNIANCEKYEVIDMNNGEKALLGQYDNTDFTRTIAYFTYDGIVYNVSAITDIDGMKEVLADLGVL